MSDDHPPRDTDQPSGPLDAPGHDDTFDDASDEVVEDGLFPAPVTSAPQTGDPVIDQALAGLEESARSGDLDAQVEAGERVHRELQERLDDLGGA